MNFKIKNKSGITLIALIITIVVMLILVAVSINILVNSNIIGHAEKTGDAYAGAIKNEQNLGNDGITINGKKYASIDDYINHKPMPSIKIKMEVTHEDTAVTADETNIKSIEHGAPIPVGYSYVTGEKNTGVVIEDETSTDQFVWVPVLQNQRIKIEVTAEEAITEIKLVDPTGTEITTPEPTGKTYTESVEPTRNGEYKLTVKTANDANENLLYVSTLYAQVVASQYTDNADTEEATVTFYKNSVNKYGGFFIARYEAGSAKPRTSGSETTDVVLSKANKYPYNYISQTESIAKAKEIANGKTSVTAGLINGAAWDRTLNWIIETNSNMSLADINEDSTSWGNYYNSSFKFKGKYSTKNGLRKQFY